MNETSLTVTASDAYTEEDRANDRTVMFGFWVYLMTDLIMFACLFAVFAVLRGNIFGGPSIQDIVDAPFALIETLILLTSSFTIGLSVLAAREGKKLPVLLGMLATFALGLAFVSMEFSEFHTLAAAGESWQRSGFLSSYFTLVGTHGFHICAGLLWMLGLMAMILRRELTQSNLRKLFLLSLFWHFLDLVWIFIFTFVYLLGIL